MASARKYLFDVSFDGLDGTDDATPAAIAAARQRQEIDAAREEGFAEGRLAGIAEAAAGSEERAAVALAGIAASLERIAADRVSDADALERSAIALTLEMGRRVVPALARRNALDEIAMLVGASLREAIGEPRVVLRVADVEFESVRDRIGRIAEAAGFPGKAVILVDEGLAPGACRIEWADGGAERDPARTWREIEAATTRAIEHKVHAEPQRGD